MSLFHKMKVCNVCTKRLQFKYGMYLTKINSNFKMFDFQN